MAAFKGPSFEALGLSKSLVESLNAMAIRRPSQIQIACIPEILKGLKLSKFFLYYVS